MGSIVSNEMSKRGKINESLSQLSRNVGKLHGIILAIRKELVGDRPLLDAKTRKNPDPSAFLEILRYEIMLNAEMIGNTISEAQEIARSLDVITPEVTPEDCLTESSL